MKTCAHEDVNKGLDEGCAECFRVSTPPWGKPSKHYQQKAKRLERAARGTFDVDPTVPERRRP